MKEVHVPQRFEDFISSESTGLDVLEVREIGKLHPVHSARGCLDQIKILLVSEGFKESYCSCLCSLDHLCNEEPSNHN